MTCLGSANRDPAKWGPTADELDLRRADARDHMSFGGGFHSCLGAHLARLEGQVAITTLVRRFPNVALATDTPEWNGRIVLRGSRRAPRDPELTATIETVSRRRGPRASARTCPS